MAGTPNLIAVRCVLAIRARPRQRLLRRRRADDYVHTARSAQTGAHLWIVETRRAPNTAIDQTVKNFNRMDVTRARSRHKEPGRDAASCCSSRAMSQRSGLNIWMVRGGALVAPCDDLLEGVRAAHEFYLANSASMRRNRSNPLEEFLRSNEAFLSTTAGGILLRRTSTIEPLGNGAQGLMTTKSQQRYWERRVPAGTARS